MVVLSAEFKRNCPKLKNNDRGNQAGNNRAPTRVYAVGNAGANPDNVVAEKLEEDLVSCLKYLHESSESSDDSTNIVNATREPIVVKQDHGVKSSQNPPPIDKCCYECGNALDGIFCQQCI
nr:hypothetical protein [Tanacetum cinerariifolium]